jgi:plastocyanin
MRPSWPSRATGAEVMSSKRHANSWKTLMLIMAVVAASCSKQPADSTSGGANTEVATSSAPPATAASYAVVVGKAPAPSSVIVLEPEREQAVPPKSEPARMDQSGRMFLPGVLLVRTGQPVTFANSDPELHNVNVKESVTREQAFNVAIPIGETYRYTFQRDGFYDVACDVHQEMTATIVATSSPYVAVADRDGSFTVTDVPAGQYALTIYAGKDTIQNPVTVTSPRTEVEMTLPSSR